MPGFGNFRSLNDFTSAEIAYLREHCFDKNVVVNGHYFYMGQEMDSYAQTTFDFRGARYRIKRHQLSLFLKKYDDTSFDMADWDDSVSTSHLCGKKRCIRPEHLELVGMDINTERVHCFSLGRCCHHRGAPDCLI